MRTRIVFVVGLAAMLSHLQPTSAQHAGNAEAGRALAVAWCAECHRVEAKSYGVFEADLIAVANLPSTTALSLRVFLQTSHKEMPNFALTPTQTDDIIAYILSLRGK
jgi:mono/diheme cytochrome c family protein